MTDELQPSIIAGSDHRDLPRPRLRASEWKALRHRRKARTKGHARNPDGAICREIVAYSLRAFTGRSAARYRMTLSPIPRLALRTT
jgi:hypothetical protein